MNILFVCGFFETTLESFRENQISRRLAERGHTVTVLTSTESHVWKFGRQRHRITNPDGNLSRYANTPNLKIVRRKPTFRAGDLVMFPLHKSDFAGVDIVHVLDFRQGITAAAARLARSLGIPVVYDHEQRGDRRGHLLHSVDNYIRRSLIKHGSKGATLVRHTVDANLEFLLSVTRHITPEQCHLAPLGADEHIFFRDAGLRKATRDLYSLSDDDRLIVCTGRFSSEKRPVDVARATANLNCRLYFCGSVPENIANELRAWPHISLLGPKSQKEVNALYNAADCALFTTFTLSYWEALATGCPIVVPNTTFSQKIRDLCQGVHLFGAPEMFLISEEQYQLGFDLTEPVSKTLERFDWMRLDTPPAWVSWDSRIAEVEAQYASILPPSAPRQ